MPGRCRRRPGGAAGLTRLGRAACRPPRPAGPGRGDGDGSASVRSSPSWWEASVPSGRMNQVWGRPTAPQAVATRAPRSRPTGQVASWRRTKSRAAAAAVVGQDPTTARRSWRPAAAAQEGELADAGLAPGGPEVDHHRAAAEGGQVDLAAVEGREAQGRGRGAGRVGLDGGRGRGRRGPGLQPGGGLAAVEQGRARRDDHRDNDQDDQDQQPPRARAGPTQRDHGTGALGWRWGEPERAPPTWIGDCVTTRCPELPPVAPRDSPGGR